MFNSGFARVGICRRTVFPKFSPRDAPAMAAFHPTHGTKAVGACVSAALVTVLLLMLLLMLLLLSVS